MKKIISIVTVVALMLALAVSAFAMPLDEAHVDAAKEFKPKSMTAAKVGATDITVDGNATAESGYSAGTDIKVPTTEDDGTKLANHATGVVRTAWSEDNLYVHIKVEDKTEGLGAAYNGDGVELYIDYDQTADGKKVLFNAFGWNENGADQTYIAQLRVNRNYTKGATIVALCYNSDLNLYLQSKTKAAVTKDANSYTVEVSIPLKDKDGKYLAKSDTLGFTAQINDGNKEFKRQEVVFINDGIQNYAWTFSHLFENLKLDEADGITWASRTVKTAVNTAYADFDPNARPSSMPEPPQSEDPPPAPVSIEDSSSEAEDISSNEDNNSSSPDDTSAQPDDEPTDGDDSDDQQTNTDGDNGDKGDKGGLPLGALIGIIAGGVVVLAGAAVVVIIIMKKKKAA